MQVTVDEAKFLAGIKRQAHVYRERLDTAQALLHRDSFRLEQGVSSDRMGGLTQERSAVLEATRKQLTALCQAALDAGVDSEKVQEAAASRATL